MIRIKYIKSVLLIYKLLFIKWFGLKTNKVNQILINHAFGKTYKFPAKAHLDKLLVLKYYVKIIFFEIKVNNVSNSHKVIVDVGFASVQNRKDFIACFTGEVINEHIGLSALRSFPSFFQKLSYLILTLPLALVLFIASLFSNKKINYALLLESIVINENLIEVVENTNTVYFFCIFELESNFYAYSLINSGKKVIKVSADVPLTMWNRNIIASSLVLCCAYQLEEVKAFSSTMEIDELLFWGPEKYHEFKELYSSQVQNKNSNSIGFYSSASWVRRADGDFEASNLFEHEEAIYKVLNRLLDLDQALELTVFLHPREKRGEYAKKSLEHYGDIFKGNRFKIADVTIPSANSFNLVDLAVSVGSTLIYERLYCGFKSVFYQDENEVPIKGSTLSNIWVKNEEAFLKKMKTSLAMSTEEFFKENKIMHYCPKYEKIEGLSR
jgi:hypothetical protein